jgi:hypothetical protein
MNSSILHMSVISNFTVCRISLFFNYIIFYYIFFHSLKLSTYWHIFFLSLFLVSNYNAVYKVQSGSSSQSLVRNELNFNSYPLFSHARVFIIFPKHIILLNVDKIVILCITSRIDVCFYWFNCALPVELMCVFIGLIVHYRCEKIWPNFLTWGKLWDTSLRS